MVICIYCDTQLPKLHQDALNAFEEGCHKQGLDFTRAKVNGRYTKCDIMVTFGTPKNKTTRGQNITRLWRAHKKRKRIVIERGYIQRDDYYMVGWNWVEWPSGLQER